MLHRPITQSIQSCKIGDIFPLLHCFFYVPLTYILHYLSSTSPVYKIVFIFFSPQDPDVLFNIHVSKPLFSALPYSEFIVTRYSLISLYTGHKKSCSGRSIKHSGTLTKGTFSYTIETSHVIVCSSFILSLSFLSQARRTLTV